MKRVVLCGMLAAAVLGLSAQTMNVNTGNITYAFPAASAGDMTFTGTTSLAIGSKTFALSEITGMAVDDSSVSDNTVSVTYNGSSANVVIAGNIAHLVKATVNGAHVTLLQSADVTSEITYTLSGSSSNGSLYMDGKLKASFVLNGLTLNNPDSAAINIRDGKRINVEIAKGTTNTLTDGSGGSQKACFAVKGHTEFDGSGTLNITGKTAHAFWGKEYVQLKKGAGTINILGAVSDGFNVNQYYQQNGGTVNISGVGDDGIQVSYKTDDDDNIEEDDENTGEILIKGGTISITTTAVGSKGMKAEGVITINESKATTTITVKNSGGTKVSTTTSGSTTTTDYTGSACIKSDSAIVIDAGTLTLTNTGQGGRAMNCEKTIDINGGTIVARAEGSNYGSSSSGGGGGFGPGGGGGFGPGGGGPGGFGPGQQTSSSGKNAKGIKAKGNLTITGGNLNVYSASHEGLESKAALSISGGTIYVKASDDAINSGGDMTILGGNVYAYSTSNDGLDSNGNMYIKGGVAVAFGAGGAETGIDIDEQHRLYITGGELFGIGGRIDSSFGTCTQSYSYTSSSISCSNGGYYVLSDSSSNRIFAVKAPASYSGIILVSSASMNKGSSYTIGSATSVSGTEVNGFIASPTVSSVSNVRTISGR